MDRAASPTLDVNLPQNIFNIITMKICDDNSKVLQLKATSESESTTDQDKCSLPSPDDTYDEDEEAASCWICFEQNTTENPLRRDCSCRGESAGFVHLSCIVEYATQKSVQWDGRDINEIIGPWRKCPNCKQSYQNELALDVANECVNMIEEEVSLPMTEDEVGLLNLLKQVRLHALALKLEALKPEYECPNGNEAEQIANEIITVVEDMNANKPSMLKRILHMDTCKSSLPTDIQQLQAFAYNFLGCIACQGADAKTALRCFKKCQHVSRAAGDDGGVAIALKNSAQVKRYHRGKKGKLLRLSQNLYDGYVVKRGEDSLLAIDAGLSFAIDLVNANREEEAEQLLTKLVAISKRVLGSEHGITREAETELHSLSG